MPVAPLRLGVNVDHVATLRNARGGRNPDPVRAARGIEGVWVNGVLSYTADGSTGKRGGRFVSRARTEWIQ